MSTRIADEDPAAGGAVVDFDEHAAKANRSVRGIDVRTLIAFRVSSRIVCRSALVHILL
jgi:hypothetical protein